MNSDEADEINVSGKHYQRLFEDAEVSLWSVDLSEVYIHLELLRQQGVTDLEAHLNDDKDLAWKMTRMVKVNHVNAATLKLYGAESEAQFVKLMGKVFLPESIYVFIKEFCAIWEGAKSFRSETKRLSLSGEELYIIISMPLPHKDADLKIVPMSNIDITDLKKSESEVRRLQKLAGLGSLAGGIAHDFNNLLTGILGSITLVQELIVGQPAAKILKRTENVVQRATRLTNQLLTFSKGGKPIFEVTNISLLVEEYVRFELAGSNVLLVVENALQESFVTIDKSQIQQAISVIVKNAIQSMPKGGRILLHVQTIKRIAPGQLETQFVEILLRDEGEGISSEFLDQVFDPYFTTKEAGRGLGLAMAHSIIEQHGGFMNIESALGRGSTVGICLPVSEETVRNLPLEKEIKFEPRAMTKILVMDDEDFVCKLLTEIFSSEAFEVRTSSHGEEALSLYKQAMEGGNPFDCVITDLTIPSGMGGEETLKHLLVMDANAKVIVSSGYSNDDIVANYDLYGFSGIVTKPYTASEIRSVVSNVVALATLSVKAQ